MRTLICLIITLVITALPAAAVESPSLDLGKTLFESTELGGSGRSCSSCHPQGQNLGQVGDFTDPQLKDIINACIRDALKGEMISTESQEMEALLKYVRTFQEN